MRKAFTMIELLVVISIIGILAAMALVSFTSSQKQARDVQRKSDIKQYQTSLEQFANKNTGLYPSHASVVSANTICGATELNLANCPIDPKEGTSPYGYKYISNGGGGITATKYGLYAYLENTGNYWLICSSGSVLSKTSVPSLSDCP